MTTANKENKAEDTKKNVTWINLKHETGKVPVWQKEREREMEREKVTKCEIVFIAQRKVEVICLIRQAWI